MTVRLLILTSFLAISSLLNAQKIMHFEQIAFEYYKDSILQKQQIKIPLSISLKVIEDGSYWNIDCLKEFNIKIDDTSAAVVSAIGTQDLKIENDKIFKVQKFKKKKTLMIFATAFMSFDIDKNIVGIVEKNKGVTTTYLFEINKEGIIRKWCKGNPKN